MPRQQAASPAPAVESCSSSSSFLPNVLSYEKTTLAPQACFDLVLKLVSPSGLRYKIPAYQPNAAWLSSLQTHHQQAEQVWPARGQFHRLEIFKFLRLASGIPELKVQLHAIWQALQLSLINLIALAR